MRPSLKNPIMLTEKPAGYYANDRADAIAQLPRSLGRVLDIGCGEGGAARPLRAAGASEVWGIEIETEAAKRAQQQYDGVAVGAVEEVLPGLEGKFDTILCYDILEHLVDPAEVLESLKSVANYQTRLHISLPNARHYSLVRDLVLRGTFGYTEYGHRDATHLRWLTRKDLTELCTAVGWTVQTTSHPPYPRRWSWLNITGNKGAEFLTYQWLVLATLDENPA